jgi:hypothetical protein
LLEKPKPIKLFCGLIGAARSIELARDLLARRFGEIDLESPVLPFTFTQYYSDEMGDALSRCWVSFLPLKERAYLAVAKHIAAMIEVDLAREGRRTVNIDPGYADDAQVVLATAKNFSHRIYIGAGYYAEVTLMYVHKVYKSNEWTYPDYKTREALEFFDRARRAYLAQVRGVAGSRS